MLLRKKKKLSLIALVVSIDFFLFGKTSLEPDKQTLERQEDISSLSHENKNFILKMIDMGILNFKTKKTFATQ